jgi:hypothetical protein
VESSLCGRSLQIEARTFRRAWVSCVRATLAHSSRPPHFFWGHGAGQAFTLRHKPAPKHDVSTPDLASVLICPVVDRMRVTVRYKAVALSYQLHNFGKTGSRLLFSVTAYSGASSEETSNKLCRSRTSVTLKPNPLCQHTCTDAALSGLMRLTTPTRPAGLVINLTKSPGSKTVANVYS